MTSTSEPLTASLPPTHLPNPYATATSTYRDEPPARPDRMEYPEVANNVPDVLSKSTDDPREKTWNPWAVPAFTVALGTVAYAILGTSAWIMVIGLIATLVLASIAVRKGRMNEWSGKGFAVSALVVGTLAALITLIALVAGGD